MNGTPRLRSAFPATPQARGSRAGAYQSSRQGVSPPQSSQAGPSPATKPIQSTNPVRPNEDAPLISLDVLDAPTQRFYAFGFYILLFGWRLYDAVNVTDDLDSTWLFLKWLGIDAAFFVALPAFRIPWLEWSFVTTITIWVLHVVANGFLMYRIPIPVTAWMGALVKVAYDRELSISEHRVKPASILHNASIILGKQIIQILPEGSAVLNPEKRAFCLDSTRTSIELPIRINQTTPISIELLRHDLDTDEIETIVIGSKQAKKLKNEADRGHAKSDKNTPRTLQYQVHKTGLYQLSRVVDQSNLEVRKRSFDVAIVPCPKAYISIDSVNKCMGELSGVSLHVEGIPPFLVKYSKRIDQQSSSSITQTISPDEDHTTTAADGTSNVVSDPQHPHRAWTKSRKVSVTINEALSSNGIWSYHIEEVEDGLSNKAMFDTDRTKKGTNDQHSHYLTVHRRPVVVLDGCNSSSAIAAPEGDSVNLPIKVRQHTLIPASDWPLKLKYNFEPGLNDGEVVDALPFEEHDFEVFNGRASPRISRPGKYSLQSIASQFCQGEILEPSSCTLYRPPQPDMAVSSQEIFDKCAGNPIGMEVNLDFTGTPPFTVYYTVEHNGGTREHSKKFEGVRGQLVFHGNSAGSYVYAITKIEDRFYGPLALGSRGFIVKQDIKPPADAGFAMERKPVGLCLGQPISMPIRFQGEGPWDLDYEIVHGGKRKKLKLHSETDMAYVDIPEHSEGGQYAVVLTAVQDRTKCKQILTDERVIEIRSERPSVAFGDIGGQRTAQILEGGKIKIPLRLQGIGPWTVSVRNIDKGTSPKNFVLKDANADITEKEAGTYELVSVRDDCHGVVDSNANKFSIAWIQRPTLSLKDLSLVQKGKTHDKPPVCQGEEDSLSLTLTGNPPYDITYQKKADFLKGSHSVVEEKVHIATNNMLVNMDTSKAGEYSYTFKSLKDHRYTHHDSHFTPISVKQQIYPLPAAKFGSPGKTYAYCKDEPTLTPSGEAQTEQIPITLTGTPPFSLEVAINHHGASHKPEITRLRDIQTNNYVWSLSRAAFDLGTHNLIIRSVSDGHGCQSTFDTAASMVRIHVTSPPTIIPLESATDYCVGDRVSFSLSGQDPFSVFYTFGSEARKATVASNEFKRIADRPGEFVITGVSDAAMGSGKCKASKDIRKFIHPYPTIKISQGKTLISDIHEGGEVDIHFEFTGTPPFEFTYTRSENLKRSDIKKGKEPTILETRHDTSDEFSKTIRASEEGTYEAVAIKDRYCAYSAVTGARSLAGGSGGAGGSGSGTKGAVGWREGTKKLLKGG